MRVWSFILVLVATLGLSSLGGPATAQTADTTAISGAWNVAATGVHFRSGTYQISQVNNVIVGSTPALAGQFPAQIDGKLKAAGYFEGQWRGPTGESGWFNMRLSPDGKAFSGQYGYNGRKAEGAIIGRLGPEAPK